MKILQINKFYYPFIGGIETFVKEIAEGVSDDEKFQVDVLACHAERGKPSVTEVINGVTVYRVRSWGTVLSMPISLHFLWQFRKIVSQYDAIVLHHPFPLGMLAYLLWGQRKSMVVWYFSDIVRQKITGSIVKPLVKWSLSKASRIIVYSKALAENSAVLPAYAEKIEVVPYGIDIDRYQETDELHIQAQKIRSQYGTPLFLAVGRLVSYKGFPVLINAVQNTGVSLLIVGSGPMHNELQEQIRSLGMQDRVHIVPSVPDVRPYYHAADVFVLPSITAAETLGVVQLEAMACGTPVINTNLPTAVPEISVHQQTGLTVAPHDVGSLRDAIVMLSNNESLRRQYGEAARNRVRQIFSKSLFMERLKQVFTEVVK